MDVINLIIIFTAISFIAYGINSFISKKMISEFKRWGLEKKRKQIGGVQLICGFGILTGIKYNFILISSSIILIIMMLVAVYVRIKIKDNISEIIPAIAYLILGILILQSSQ
ncbi:MAG: hypothetical protein CMC37_00560 [Flavobacteriaceae bacterium]|nr:hypothetical protein [Flavobacteriaceae bacterium]|tara:strand:+ start:1841 stop:2176 length:336 start_codon:yes stop_codon:yes gene_type:complete